MTYLFFEASLPKSRFGKLNAMPRAWDAAARVLCVRLDTIGDVLMTGPAIRALRDSQPGRVITLLTSPAGAAVAELMPEVDDAIVYEAPWMKGHDPPGDTAIVETLRERSFDAAAIFTVFSQSALPAALVCHQAGIPLRLAHAREKPYALLTDWVPEPEPDHPVRHEVQRQLDLVASVGASTADERLALRLPDAARERARTLVPAAPAPRWAVVHPGGTAPSRRYPIEMWREVCELLSGRHGFELIATGDPSERKLAEQLPATYAGELSLAELAALLSAAPLLLSGNTGPVHLAAAVGTPVVDVYALTNPQHTPWMVESRVLSRDVPCRWCYSSVCLTGHHQCVRGVSPAEVVSAALELLGLSERRSA